MMNIFIAIGKLVEVPVLKETTNGTKHATLLLEVERGFRNSDGVFENDLMQVEIWRGVAETVVDCCKIGELLTIKGRVQANPYQNNEGVNFINYDIIAEKVTFLSNR